MICQKGNEAQNTHSKLSPLIGVVGSFCFIFIYTGEIAFADEICTATASSKYYNECKQVQIKISQESLSLLKERSELIDSIKDYFGTKQEEAAIRNKNFIKNITACDADEVCLTGAFEAQLKFYESRLINKGIDVQAFMNQSVVIRESKSLLAEIKQAALIEAKKRDAAIALDRKIMADKANFDRKQAEEDRVQSEIATARSTVEYLKQAAEEERIAKLTPQQRAQEIREKEEERLAQLTPEERAAELRRAEEDRWAKLSPKERAAEEAQRAEAKRAKEEAQRKVEKAEEMRKQAEIERQAQLKREDEQRRLEIARLEADKAKSIADAERAKADSARAIADAKATEVNAEREKAERAKAAADAKAADAKAAAENAEREKAERAKAAAGAKLNDAKKVAEKSDVAPSTSKGKAKDSLKVKDIALAESTTFCRATANDYLNIINVRERILMSCSVQDGPKDTVAVFFDGTGKSVVNVYRTNYFTFDDPDPSAVFAKAVQFYGQPRTKSDNIAVYGNAHDDNGDRLTAGEGKGLSIRLKNCVVPGMRGSCPSDVVWRLTYELVDNSNYEKALAEGKLKVDAEKNSAISNQKF